MLSQIWTRVRRAFQVRRLVTVIAVAAALIVVVAVSAAFGAAPAAAQGPTAPSGCEMVLNVSWTRDASVPAGGELAVPAPPSGDRIFCVDGLTGSEAGAIELTNMAVFTATAGTAPVVLNITGAALTAGLPLNETEQGYALSFAPGSPVPSIKLVDNLAAGIGFSDVRIFWGSPKGTGRATGQLGTWKAFKIGGTDAVEITWAKGVKTEFRLKASSPVDLTIAGGTDFAVDGLGLDPTCTRLGCTLLVPAFTGGTFKVTPTAGGWVSVEASGPAGSTIELWVPQGTTAAPAAVTSAVLDPKGGGGFPATYLPLMRK